MQQEYERWLTYEHLDEGVRNDLLAIREDEAEIEECFYEKLSFGTGGIRGKLGPGPNRMNVYTVRKAAKGLANYVKTHTVNYENRGVVIAYDPRHMSEAFAFEVAKVLGVDNIKTYIFDTIQPTPLLSFAVRYLRTVAGIMITASHNPPEYNGLKVYNEAGSQITSAEADNIIASINAIEDELQIETKSKAYLEEHGLLQMLQDEVSDAYLKQILPMSSITGGERPAEKDLGIVFTPLHGTATRLVSEGLRKLEFTNLHIVEEQTTADPEFSTVASPNPEDPRAFTKAIELGKSMNADILLATDPDADRLGVAVKNKAGAYETLTGNELGALLLDFILAHTDERLLPNARMIKTIVTSEFGRAIASSYGVKTIDTLTGFKYIGEKINEFDRTGERFIFGYEESYGYLMSTCVRDKDGVHAAIMACELAQYWRDRGLSLVDALDRLYEKHGYYKEGIGDLTLEGISGIETIAHIVERFRTESFSSFGKLKSLYKEDYLYSERRNLQDETEVLTLDLPKENVVKYILADGCWVCVRPSGTEPKIKWYYGAYGESEEEVNERLEMLESTLHDIIVKEKRTKVY
ncbi:MAG TPA: phospho-sugar mutase [Pseudogracilibacillus sp.]|nr:phospho-sugar mutase [Pseudogracilibacillus sp.]